jgi:hypothetical protein
MSGPDAEPRRPADPKLPNGANHVARPVLERRPPAGDVDAPAERVASPERAERAADEVDLIDADSSMLDELALSCGTPSM